MNAMGPVQSWRDALLRSYFHEPQKNKIYFLNDYLEKYLTWL